MDQTDTPSHNRSLTRGKKRGKIRGEKTPSALKVKLPKFRHNVAKEDRTRTDGRIHGSTKATDEGAGAKCTFESRTTYFPWFGSSQVDEPQPDQTEPRPQSQAHKRWNNTVKTRGVGSDSGSVGTDVFDFSQTPTSKTISEKEKAKLAVLRTISRVLEENQLIRQRLAVLRQATEAVLTD